MSELYAAVRAEPSPERGHALWRACRDGLFRGRSAEPAGAGRPAPGHRPARLALRPTAAVLAAAVAGAGAGAAVACPPASDGTTALRLIGRVELPRRRARRSMCGGWSSTAAGLFLPLRDGTAGPAATAAGGICSTRPRGPTSAATDGSRWLT